MREIECREIVQRQVNQGDPRRLRRGSVKTGDKEEFAGPGGGDIPEPDALPVEFCFFGVTDFVITDRPNAEDGTVEMITFPVGDGSIGRDDCRHGVDRNDDRPLQAFGGVYRIQRDRLFLRVRASFDRTRLVSPSRSHGLGERAQAAHRVGPGQTNVEIDIGQCALSLPAMALQEYRTYTQHIDGLRQKIMRRCAVRPTAKCLQLLKNLSGQGMPDGLQVDAQIKVWQRLRFLFGAWERPNNVEQLFFRQADERPPEQSAKREGVAPVGENAG